METIFEALRESHEIQRRLCRVMTSKRYTPMERKEAFLELAIELDAHASAEERYFYSPLQVHDEALSASRHAVSEHHEAEELVDHIRSLDPKGKAFLGKAKELSKKVHHHLKDEEKGFFQLSGKLLTSTQKTKLTKQYLADYNRMKKKLSKKK